MSNDGLQRLLKFLSALKARHISYRIEREAADSLLVTFTAKNRCVEVDFSVADVSYSVFSMQDLLTTDEVNLYALIDKHGS